MQLSHGWVLLLIAVVYCISVRADVNIVTEEAETTMATLWQISNQQPVVNMDEKLPGSSKVPLCFAQGVLQFLLRYNISPKRSMLHQLLRRVYSSTIIAYNSSPSNDHQQWGSPPK